MSDGVPQVSPDLAGKVLAAEKRNVIKAVGEGGTLPAPLRREMQSTAMTPELAAQQRASALLAKFCAGGDLTPAQWEEVRAGHPGFADVPPPPAVTAVAPAQESAAFALAAELPKLNKADRARFVTLYGKGWRTIYRWLELGEEKNDPCPLANPSAMPAWWERWMTWTCPHEVLAAAAAHQQSAPPPMPVPSGATPPMIRAVNPQQPPEDAQRIISLADFDPEEGDRLRELKQVQGAKFNALKDAIERGQDSTVLETKYLKLCETVDKIETRAIERMKKRKLYILRAEVDADIAANAELLRQSHESMKRRVLERCTSLNAEQRAEVGAAIEVARAAEIKMLCRLGESTADEVELELAS